MFKALGYPISIWLIFFNEFCERFSYHGLQTILVIFLKTILKYNNGTPTIIYHIFMMCANVSPIFGAIIADSYWGKYKTIYNLSIVHVIGNIILTVASLITAVDINYQRSFTIIGLLLTAIGAGGIKPCVSSFGGDQFILPDQEDQLRKFFSAFYFTISVGCLFSFLITPELRKSVQCFGRNSCFPLAFGVLTFFMMLSIILFVSGKRLYKIERPTPSVFISSLRCILRAIKNKITAPSNDEKKEDWLEYAGDKYSKNEIFDVRCAINVIFLCFPLTMYHVLHDQQGSSWTLQATLMNGRINFLKWTLKPDQVHLINPLSVLVLIPMFDAVVYPLLYKVGLNTPLRKIIVGGIFTIFSFLCAAAVQYAIIGGSQTISSNEAYLRIYNNMNCTITISNPLIGKFSIEPLDKFQTDCSQVIKESIDLTININSSCQLNAYTIKQNVLIIKGQVSSYVSSRTNDGGFKLKYLNKRKKLKSGNPNIRFLYDENLSDKNIILKDIHNKTTGISIQLPHNQDQNYEIPVGIYKIYLDSECVLQKINFLPASICDLLLHNNFNNTNAKLFTLEHGNYVHILWQVPQTILLAIGETMFLITLLEFSFTQAPLSMKTLLTAANLCKQAAANLIIIIISEINFFENQGHEFLFYAVLMSFSMGQFIFMSIKYEYKIFTADR